MDEYLPLFWTKRLEKEIGLLKLPISTENLYNLLLNSEITQSEKDEILHNNPEFSKIMYRFNLKCIQAEQLNKFPEISNDKTNIYNNVCKSMTEFFQVINNGKIQNVMREMIDEFKTYALVDRWSYDKQVFKFDKELIESLAYADNLKIYKDFFDYLPTNIFCVDISESEKISNEIIGKFLFVHVGKDKVNDIWKISLVKITEKYFFFDTISIPNKDMSIDEYTKELCNDGTIRIPKTKEKVHINDNSKMVEAEFNASMYRIIILQILSYLSQPKPDVIESPETKQTYRKPKKINGVKPKPKNRYAEIRQWVIGTTYGNAVRNARKRREASATTDEAGIHTTKGTGTPKRPHRRNGHWHGYWMVIGRTETGEPIKQKFAKYINPYYTGELREDKSAGKAQSAVVHKCFKDAFKEATGD